MLRQKISIENAMMPYYAVRIIKTILLLFFVSTLQLVLAQNYRSEQLKSAHHFQVKGNKLIRIDSVCLKINERNGDKDAQIGIYYSKGETVDILYAYIKDKNGIIVRELKKSDIKTQSYISDISLYDDAFIKTFELKHNSYPYTIHYAVRVTKPKFFQITAFSLLHEKNLVKDGKIVVETTSNMPIKYKQQHMEEPEVLEKNGIIKYIWKYDYAPAQNIEVNADYNISKIPQLIVVPLHFKYGEKGSWENWQTFGNWVHRLNKGRDILPESEKRKVNQLIAGVSDNKKKAAILYRYLQKNTRYINVTIDIGGFQTYPAEYVYTNRYGDCKALSNYMQALLKHAGIPSYYTLIYSGKSHIEVDENFPSQVFNHAILTVPFGSDTVFLENTNKNIPFGYIPTSIQGKRALMITENNSRLITLPSKEIPDVACSRHIHVKNNTSLLKSIQRGRNYERFNEINAAINQTITDQYIRNNILPTGAYYLVNYNFFITDPDSAQIDLKAQLAMENIVNKYNNNVVISSFPILLPKYEHPTSRMFGIEINIPTYYKDTIIYELDWDITKIPEDIAINTPFGIYRLNFEHVGNKFIVYKTILIYNGKYARDEYEEFYTFMQAIFNNENRKLYLTAL